MLVFAADHLVFHPNDDFICYLLSLSRTNSFHDREIEERLTVLVEKYYEAELKGTRDEKNNLIMNYLSVINGCADKDHLVFIF